MVTYFSSQTILRSLRCAAAGGLLVAATLGCRLGITPTNVGALPPDVEVVQLPGVSTINLKLSGLTVPDTTSILFTVHSPSAMPRAKSLVLTPEALKQREADGKPIFEQLPAAKDVVLRAYLRGADDLLLAAGQATVTLGRKGNDVTLPITTQVTPPEPLRASDGVKVSDHMIIKGIEVDLSTGLPDGMPGIGKIAIEISGPAYGNGTEVAEVAIFDAPTLAEYSWRPASGSRQFDPARLTAGEEARPFTLTTKAIDTFGNMVGKTRLDLSIIGTAFVDVGFDPGSN